MHTKLRNRSRNGYKEADDCRGEPRPWRIIGAFSLLPAVATELHPHCLPPIPMAVYSWPANAVDVLLQSLIDFTCHIDLFVCSVLFCSVLCAPCQLFVVILLIDNCGNAWHCKNLHKSFPSNGRLSLTKLAAIAIYYIVEFRVSGNQANWLTAKPQSI